MDEQMTSVDAQPRRGSYFMVMPEYPTNGYTLYPPGGYASNLGQGMVGLSSLYPHNPPVVMVYTVQEAHTKAQALVKAHNCRYFVTEVKMIGQYIPPPPEWTPAFKDAWVKPA